jgi:hypothetical protein
MSSPGVETNDPFAPETGDIGARPLPGSDAVHSAGLRLVDAAGATVNVPVPGRTYNLQATVRNLGATAAYAH